MSLRSSLLLGCFAIGFGLTHCSGDSKNGGGDGSEPDAGSGGDAGEPGTGGSSGTRGGTSGSSGTGGSTGGRGGTTSTGGAAGDGGDGGSSGAGDGGVGADGGVGGGGGEGGTGSPTCVTTMPSGTLVSLAQPTATFSQTMVAPFTVATAIDGMKDQMGWAVAPNSGSGPIAAQTAAFETVANTPSFTGGTRLVFVLTHDYTATGDHALGRFRVSVTNVDRSMFADGNLGTATPGDVGAPGIWTALTPVSACALGDVELTTLSDASLLVEVNHVAPQRYVLVAETTLTGITGVRLEALQDASLPFNGPGLQILNGNFVLTEFEVYVEAR